MSFTDSEGDWGEPPSDEALGYQLSPNRPHPIPTDPENMIGRPPYYENVNWFTDMPPWLQRFESLFPDSRAPSPPYHAEGNIRSDEPDPSHIPGMPSVAEMRNLAPNITLDDGTVFGNPFFDPSDAPLPRPRPMDYNTDDVPNYLNLPDRRGPTPEEMLDAAGQPISIPGPGIPLFRFLAPWIGPLFGYPPDFFNTPLPDLPRTTLPDLYLAPDSQWLDDIQQSYQDSPAGSTMDPLGLGGYEVPGNQISPVLPGYVPPPQTQEYSPTSYQSSPPPPIEALSTAPSFTDTSPELMGGIAEISDGEL